MDGEPTNRKFWRIFGITIKLRSEEEGSKMKKIEIQMVSPYRYAHIDQEHIDMDIVKSEEKIKAYIDEMHVDMKPNFSRPKI